MLLTWKCCSKSILRQVSWEFPKRAGNMRVLTTANRLQKEQVSIIVLKTHSSYQQKAQKKQQQNMYTGTFYELSQNDIINGKQILIFFLTAKFHHHDRFERWKI